jgi:hypothetical protein
VHLAQTLTLISFLLSPRSNSHAPEKERDRDHVARRMSTGRSGSPRERPRSLPVRTAETCSPPEHDGSTDSGGPHRTRDLGREVESRLDEAAKRMRRTRGATTESAGDGVKASCGAHAATTAARAGSRTPAVDHGCHHGNAGRSCQQPPRRVTRYICSI